MSSSTIIIAGSHIKKGGCATNEMLPTIPSTMVSISAEEDMRPHPGLRSPLSARAGFYPHLPPALRTLTVIHHCFGIGLSYFRGTYIGKYYKHIHSSI